MSRVFETGRQHKSNKRNEDELNNNSRKGNNKSESSINTSSASSSGYISNVAPQQQQQSYNYRNTHMYGYRIGSNVTELANKEKSFQPKASNMSHHQQYSRHHQQMAAAYRASNATQPPMVPMMIDDDDDEEEANFQCGADLIDDDGDDDDDDNIEAKGFHRHQHQQFNHSGQHHINGCHQHNIDGSQARFFFNGNTIDCANSSTDLVGHFKLEHTANKSLVSSNATHNRHQNYHVIPTSTQIIDRGSTYLNNKQVADKLETTYYLTNNQPFGNNKQISQQYHQHSVAYYQPEEHQYSIHHQKRQLPGTNAARSLLENRIDQLIGLREHNFSSYINKPDNNNNKNRSFNFVDKMQQTGSRQQLTSSAQDSNVTQQHHRHHHSSSKRKTGTRKQTPSKSMPSLNDVAHSNNNGRPTTTLGFCGKVAKMLLFIANILFWSTGIALGAWGILSLVDDHKYNLSQLLVFEPNSRMSLFQLLSWSFITLGCATILVGFCGCSAILKNNRWILGLYIFLILAIFALDLATGLLAIIFQERLVANVRLRLGNKLRSEYGVQASFTAAIDYIQTRYECCGLEGHFDYDQSLWRLQRLGGFEATVARTCCHLRNTFDDQAHINPRPVNESMCQSTDVRFHQSYRYRKGCLDDLERLVRHKIWNFTIGCAAVGAIILLSLFFATCFCRSIPNASSRKSSQDQDQKHHSSNVKR